MPTRHGLEKLLAGRLDSPQLGDLRDLVGYKNNQLTTCVGQLNASVPGPNVPAGWISRTAGRLLDALHTGFGLRLNLPDCDYLREACDWMNRTGLGTQIAKIRGLLPPPGQPAFVPAGTVPCVIQEWKHVEIAVRMRRLPSNWGKVRPVQDLFFDPLQDLFGRWVVRATLYGL